MRLRFILLGAELLAVAVLHIVFMLRRDKPLPQGSKVPWIRGIPVLKNTLFAKKPPPPREPFSIEGWTPRRPGSKMPVPDVSPGE